MARLKALVVVAGTMVAPGAGMPSVWAGGFVGADCNDDTCLTPVIVHGP